MNLNGFLFVDKEAGPSSRKRDNLIRRKFSCAHVGHLGTLDPFASGLLIVALGEGTKRLPYLPDGEKEYLACLILGRETDTLDLTGKIIGQKDVPYLSKEEILLARKDREGVHRQEIPSYSASHIQGKRRYELAREGIKREKKRKEVEIKNRKLVSFDQGKIVFSALVSKGTYVRQLGLDLAKRLNTVGYLSSLRRLSIGKFSVKEAKPLAGRSTCDRKGREELFPDIPCLEAKDDRQAKKAAHGNERVLPSSSPLLFRKEKGKILSLYRKEGDKYVCAKGFNL